MSDTIDRLRERLDTTIENHTYLEDDLQMTEESIEFIEGDLKATPEEFVATTGKEREEFFQWQRKAKGALHHKKEHARNLKRQLADVKLERSRLEMLLRAEESDYRGDDPLRLLLAMDRMLREVMEEVGYEPSEEQDTLLAVVKAELGELDQRYA